MKGIVDAYRFLNMLSIDVALGAVVCGAFFARIVDIHVRPQGLAALGITVWIIYTVDHLLDVRRMRQEASTERHLFHQRHLRTLSVWVIVAIVLDTIMVLFIRREVFVWGTQHSFIAERQQVFFGGFIRSVVYSEDAGIQSDIHDLLLRGILLPRQQLTHNLR